MTIAQDIAADRRRGITNPQHVDEIRARIAFARLSWWRRLFTCAPAGWRRY